jgi:copper homeostasis protein
MSDHCLVEVAVSELSHAKKAEALGADRIELCTDLKQGGITPSYGLIKACAESLKIPVHVMIRCRPGNFNYSEEEFQLMLHDVTLCDQLGVRGVVFGFLNTALSLDETKCKFMADHCRDLGLKMTFHRAIDICKEPMSVMEKLIDLGIENVLTSGGEKKAENGLIRIKEYVDSFENRINIIAGSGLQPDNVGLFISAGVKALHLSGHTPVRGGDEFDFGEMAIFNHERVKGVLDECRK